MKFQGLQKNEFKIFVVCIVEGLVSYSIGIGPFWSDLFMVENDFIFYDS